MTIASTAAIRGHGYGAGYTASKGGVDALTRLLAVQYGPHGVRANCICPGGVDTPMTGGMFATPEAQERARTRVPLGRYAQPEDIGDVAVFLLSDDARYLTGQTVAGRGRRDDRVMVSALRSGTAAVPPREAPRVGCARRRRCRGSRTAP